jgi:beta-lactamase class A
VVHARRHAEGATWRCPERRLARAIESLVLLNQTVAQMLRAGLPSDWHVGDKTGAATHANNDIAIVWPPRREPLLVAAYYMAEKINTAERKAVLAEVGRIVASSTT